MESLELGYILRRKHEIMKFESTPLKDAWLITMVPFGDDRGHFARSFCRNEFEAFGIPANVAQCNISFNALAGTMRGMHYQASPMAETKLVQCLRGALYDVIVDMRPESPTYHQHFGVELSAENFKMLYVPANFAHGFLTLKDNSLAHYMMGEFYSPECERGVRYNDPELMINWPIEPVVVSDKDRNWPLL